MNELTEDLLIKAGSYAVFQQARALVAAGKVTAAAWNPPVLRGKITEGRRTWAAGLKITGPREIAVLCLCPEASKQGKICVHAVAVGLAALAAPVEKQGPTAPLPTPAPRPPEVHPFAVEVARQLTTELPAVKFSFEGSLRHLDAEVVFSYSAPGLGNPPAEEDVLQQIAEAGWQGRVSGQAWSGSLRGEAAILRWFADDLPRWEKRWVVTRGERFGRVSAKLIPLTPRYSFQPLGAGDWLNFRLHFQAGSQAVLGYDEVRRLLASGKQTLELRGGLRAVVPSGLVGELGEVLQEINPERTLAPGTWKIPPEQSAYLRSTLGDTLEKQEKTALPPLPEGICLRPYQVEGFQWLAALARRGLGGLLADDMGLGKTLQALCLVASRPGPHLVVCPASLVWNWTREARRFFPQLNVLPLRGGERGNFHTQLSKCDLALTSYGILRRDVEILAAQAWDCVLLDEAQHIKNPVSQNARAARRLRARARFVLSGTPLENSLRDLWSLYEFALPGYLGSAEEFRERYELPLQSAAPPERRRLAGRLHRRLAAYFLRRDKRSVLPELPPRVEQTLEVELTPRQKALYDQIQAQARRELDALKDQGSSGQVRLRILAALLRLRQVCCDTRLLGDPGDPAGEVESLPTSGKLSALLELLGEATDGGHRVLVFSQFTRLLDLLEPLLDSAGLGFVRLDGSTRDRPAVVDRFQSPSGPPVFLLSLKAGGAGLNLTAADTVVHLDPWWNPAVEAQAIDRAHRLGQSRCVTSIKLIARDTVEEKVLRLQEEKRELFAAAVDGENAWESLSESDLRQLLPD